MSQPNVIEIHSGIVLKGQLSMARDVVLTGKFEGDLHTLGCLTVAPGGAATGSISAGALILEPGNMVQARVKVRPPQKAAVVRALEEKPKPAAGGLLSGGFRKLKELALGRQ